MVSRERLLRLAATTADRATGRRVRVVAQLLLVAALVFVVVRVRSIWHGGHITLAGVDWLALGAAFILGVIGTAATAWIWLSILGKLGVRTRRSWSGLFFKAQLGKYIPGSVWQYAGRAAAARAHGIPVRPVALSLPIELTASTVAAGATGAFLLGWWGAIVIAAVAALLVAAARFSRSRGPAVPATIRAALVYLPVWLLFGAMFWLCARALVAAPAHDLAFYSGSFAVAWLVGLVAIYAPGGLGVREAVLVALLSGRLHTADALVVASVSRLILILIDLVLAAVAIAAMRSARARLDIANLT